MDEINLPKIYANAPKALAYHQGQYSSAYGQLSTARMVLTKAELEYKQRYAQEYCTTYDEELSQEKCTRGNIPLTKIKEACYIACIEEYKAFKRAELQYKRLQDLIEASSKEIDTQKKLMSLNEGKAT